MRLEVIVSLAKASAKSRRANETSSGEDLFAFASGTVISVFSGDLNGDDGGGSDGMEPDFNFRKMLLGCTGVVLLRRALVGQGSPGDAGIDDTRALFVEL